MNHAFILTSQHCLICVKCHLERPYGARVDGQCPGFSPRAVAATINMKRVFGYDLDTKLAEIQKKLEEQPHAR